MADPVSTSLINIGEIAKPADTLIKKVSAAVGGICAPWQIKRIAKAETEAALIRAQGEIEITDLHRRAVHRFVEEEAQRQKNMEDITARAINHLSETANPEAIANDWITNFFDKCRIISDEQMQDLWAKILAGEANAPGAYSRRTVNLLGDLDRIDAELFTQLCRFSWWLLKRPAPLVFDHQNEIYTKHGVTFATLSHLDDIGLIQFDGIAEFRRMKLTGRKQARYYDKPLLLNFPPEGQDLLFGHVMLTKAGDELAAICHSKPIDGFYEYVRERWKGHLQDISGTSSTPGPKPV